MKLCILCVRSVYQQCKRNFSLILNVFIVYKCTIMATSFLASNTHLSGGAMVT